MPYTPILATLGYVLSPDRRRVLMVHRNARPGDQHLGKYNGLGGKLEADEDALAGMRREIREEAAIDCDEIQLRDRSRNIPMIVETLANPALTRPEWLSWDDQKYVAKLTRLPESDEVPFPIDIQLVVQYYAMLV